MTCVRPPFRGAPISSAATAFVPFAGTTFVAPPPSSHHTGLVEVPVLVPYCLIRSFIVTRSPRPTDRQAGQATAEYALVLLGAAAIALVFAAWAARSGKIAELFDRVLDLLLRRAK